MSAHSEKDFLDFEDLLDSVIAVDKEGKIRAANHGTLRLLGYKKKEELIMLPVKQICKTISLERLKDRIPLREEELVYLSREGKEIPVSVNIMGRISYPDDIIFVARDITKTRDIINELTKSREELKKSYVELTRSKDELVRSEKLAYTGRIAASIAHEIRNPLTNVGMALHRLAQETSGDKYITIIGNNIERINYLITELLNCARPPKLNLRIYDIHDILKEVLKSLKTKIEMQKIEVIKTFTSKLSEIQVDKEQMARAFLNIILNAIEAMHQKGVLTITTELNEDFFVVKIRDTGKGIPEEDIIRIYDPFFSSKSGGVGLGLTVTYGIISSHGGTIEVDSKPKKGTIFTVSLPSFKER